MHNICACVDWLVRMHIAQNCSVTKIASLGGLQISGATQVMV